MYNKGKNLIPKNRKIRKSFLSSLFLLFKILVIIFIIASAVNVIFKVNQAEAAFGLSTSLKQVKTASSPVVYYLDHKRGLKKVYVKEASYLAYGNKWSEIKIISQQQLNKWPEMHLVKAQASPAIYYIKNNQKALIKSPQEFIDLGFKWQDVVTIAKADLENYQIVDLQQLFSYPGPVATGQADQQAVVTVKLDDTSPKDNYIPLTSKKNLVAVYNFSDLNQTTEIKGLTFGLTGVFPESAVNIYLANQADYIYDVQASLINRRAIFNFASQPIIINPGQTIKIKIYLDLGNYENSVANSLQVSLDTIQSISTTAQVKGDFPFKAGVFKFTLGDNLGQVQINELPLTDSNDAIIGTTNKIIAKFNISETSGNEDIIIKQIKLINNGNAADGSLKSFKLTDSYNNIVAQVPGASNGSVIFKLNDYKINKKSNSTFLVTADVVNGEKQTINFDLDDAFVIGNDYNFGLNVSFNNLNQTVEIIRQSLGILAINLKASSKVFTNEKGSIIGNFQIRNNDQQVNLQSINIILIKNNNAPNLTGEISLVDYNSGQIYDSADAAVLAYRNLDLSFNNLFLQPKQELSFSLITDIPEEVNNGDNYKIIINKVNYKVFNGQIFQDDINISGETLVVSKSNLYIYPNNNEKELSYTKGQKNIKVASFILEAAAGDNVIISSMTLAKSSQSSGSLLYENGFSNLRVNLGYSQASNIIDKPFGTAYQFDGFNYLLPAGQRIEARVYVDTVKDLKVSELQLELVNIVARSEKSGLRTIISGLNTDCYKTIFGQAKASLQIVNGGSVTSGSKNNKVANFSIKNTGDEALSLEKLIINTTTEGFSYSLGYSNLSIIDQSNNRIGMVVQPVAGANMITSWFYTINQGQEITFTITVDANASVPNANFELYLSDAAASGKTSNIKADFSGDPTDKIPVVVNGTTNNN